MNVISHWKRTIRVFHAFFLVNIEIKNVGFKKNLPKNIAILAKSKS